MRQHLGPAVMLVGLALGQLIAVNHVVFAQEFAGREKLRAHSGEFRQEVVKVTDGVYVAVGFSLANSILIEGTDGVVIVDTLTQHQRRARGRRPSSTRSPESRSARSSTRITTPITLAAPRVFAGTDRPGRVRAFAVS